MAQKIISKKLKRMAAEILNNCTPTPFYLLDLEEIKNKFIHFRNTIDAYFPGSELAYSIKSNNLKKVLNIAFDLGWSVEGVSINELLAAAEDGFPANRVIFDGPVKNSAELEYCLANGLRLQIDSLDELKKALAIAGRLDVRGQIGLRVAHKYRGNISRFGLDLEELEQAVQILRNSGHELCGVHIHCGSNMLNPNALIEIIGEYSNFINQHLPGGGWIDLGGGFPADSASHSVESPTLDSYLSNLADGVSAKIGSLTKWRFIFEPGRCLVEDDGYLITKISHEKKRNRYRILICDAGVNQAISMNSWAHSIECIADKELTIRNTFFLAGSNCFESDYFGSAHISDVKINPGDSLIIRGCGGYDIMSANAWIRASIAVYGIENEKCLKLRHAGGQASFRHLDVVSGEDL